MVQGKRGGLNWLISGRGYAMFGIYIGHVMGEYYNAGYSSSLGMGRFMQVGILPFFMVLIGAFYQKPQQRFLSYLWLKFSQRIIPVYFYTILVIPFAIMFATGSLYNEVWRWLPYYLLGFPLILSMPCWFLVGMFSSELVYSTFVKKLKSKKSLWAAMLVFYVIAWTANTYKALLPSWIELVSNIWMIQSVPLFLMFFVMGAALKKFILNLTKWSNVKVLGLCVGAYVLMLPGVILNVDFPSNHMRGIKHYLSDEMPMMFIGQYGDFVWFFMACFFGVFGWLALSRLLPSSKFMCLVGDHSMTLLGLNAIFHRVLNLQMVRLAPLPADTWYWSLLYSGVVALIQLAAALVVALLLTRYLPQLNGKPMLRGPILPALYRKK